MNRALVLLSFLLGMPALADVRVAVVPFDNAGGAEFEGLGVGLQSMVTTDLAQADAVTVVERARIHDLLAEMQLAKDGVIDPATAVQIGKVSGATHVVAGSFTVVGDTMRLDVRLAEVATGKVTVAAEEQGERDAFFELEKSVVTKLLAGMGAELTPKERAAVARLHTADFDSFSQFSRGVALFDADRYDEAVAILEAVSQTDADFKLASVTLADLRAVQEQAEKKAMAARVTAAEEKFVGRQEASREGVEVLARLQADAADPKKSWQERSTANLLIAAATGISRSSGGLRGLRDGADAFAMERLGERAYQAWWAESRDRVPTVFPLYRDWWTPMTLEKYTYEEHFEHNLGRFFTGTNDNYVMSSCKGGFGDEQLGWLWLPRVRQLEVHASLLKGMRACLGDAKYAEALLDVAEHLTDEGRVGPAAALLQELSGQSQDERLLSKVATAAKESAERKAGIDAFPVGSPEWELVMFGNVRVESVERSRAEGRVVNDVNYYSRAKLPGVAGPIFVSGVPVWSATRLSDRTLLTGPKLGRDETTSLRHYGDDRGRAKSPADLTPGRAPPTSTNLLLMGGVPRKDGTVRATFDYTPAADWFPLQRRGAPSDQVAGWTPLPDRPLAGVVVAVREIETDPICDPVDPQKMTPIPTTAYGVLIDGDAVVVAELEEVYAAPDRCASHPNHFQRFGVKAELARKPLKDRGPYAVEVSVKGTKLTASVGSTKVSADLPEARVGFPGVYVDGDGYVELSGLALE
ncbi:MAG: CsgG/HfaB family protein [Myxococcota bacterium]